MIDKIKDEEGFYEGCVLDNEKHGQGCYLWYNGNFYNGYWEHGKITGDGALYYANGGILKGTFLEGKLTGIGRGIYSNGDTYVGTWKSGMFNGKGLFYIKEVHQWQLGEFEDGNLIRAISQGEGKPSSLSNTCCECDRN